MQLTRTPLAKFCYLNGGCGRGSAIDLIATYLLGESAPWISFFGEARDLFQLWWFDVTCRDAVLGRRAPYIVCHLKVSDSTAFVRRSLPHAAVSCRQMTRATSDTRLKAAPASQPSFVSERAKAWAFVITTVSPALMFSRSSGFVISMVCRLPSDPFSVTSWL